MTNKRSNHQLLINNLVHKLMGQILFASLIWRENSTEIICNNLEKGKKGNNIVN